MRTVLSIACLLLTLYSLVLLARVIFSFVRVPPSGPVRTLAGIVYDLTEPVLRPLRAILPPVRMGIVALDLSIFVAFIVIALLRTYAFGCAGLI